MDTLLFIRHAETDLAGRFCGHSDPPINERGRFQIEHLLEVMEHESIDAVYSSDLVRSMTTATEIAGARGLSPVTRPGLREIDFGEWDGLSWDEIESRDRDYASKWSQAYPVLPAPGGELFEEFQTRVLTEVNDLLAVSSQRRAAVVTHGGVMRVVLRSLCGLDEQDAWDRTKAYCGFFHYPLGGFA